MSRRLRLALLLAVAVALVAGCVGPARTTARYEGKATRTANDAVSALNTAALAVRTSQRGSLLGPYLNVILTSAETALGSVQQSFDSIQPPGTDRADTLRDALDKLLTSAADVLSQLRILARRGDEGQLVQQAGKIPALVKKLEAFVQQASA